MLRNLKRKKNLLFLSVTVLTFSLTQSVSGQTTAGTGESNWGGTQPDVRNTGNDVANFAGTGINLGVTVWDGSNAAMGWEYNGLNDVKTLVNSSFNDPDVAMSDVGHCSAIVYELSGDIYLERYYFDPSIPDMILFSGPTLISNGSGNAKNPNIDAINSGEGVVVWSENLSGSAEIFTRGIKVCGNTLFPIVGISSPYTPSANSIQPDVSIYDDASGSIFYNYAYVNKASGNGELIYQIEEASVINSGSLGTAHYVSALSRPLPEHPRFPRIASHLSGTGFSFVDASTIAFMIPTGNDIITYSNIAGVNSLTSSVTPNLTACTNRKPAICWTDANEYVVGWRYKGNCGGVNSVVNDLLSTKLDINGSPITTNVFSYQWVNQLVIESQGILSLASRYSASGEILSGFYADVPDQMLYKYTNSTATPYFREAVIEDETTLNESLLAASLLNTYPNPVSDVLSIETTGMESVALYNATGQIVHVFEKADLANQSVLTIQVKDFPSGIYLLKARGNEKIHTKKIIIEK